MKETVCVLGMIICVIGLAIGLSCAEAYSDKTAWNGGHCAECGGSYELSGVSHVRNGGDLFYYSCEECGDTIRTHHAMKKSA